MNYKANIWKMNLFMFLRGFQLFAGIIIPFYMVWGKLSYFQISILLASYFVSVFLFEVPTGVIADKFGRKNSLIFGALINGIAMLIYGSYPNFYVLLTGEVFWALGLALISGANDALVYDSLKKLNREKESKKFIGRFRSFDVFAIGVAAPIGSYLSGVVGLREVMLLSSIGPFLALFLAMSLIEPPLFEKRKKYFVLVKEGIKYFSNHKILKILVLDQISTICFVMFMFIGYQQVLITMGFDKIYLGFVHSSLVVAQVLIMNLFGVFEKFVSNRRLLFLFALITGFSYIGIYFSNSIVLVIILFIIAQGVGFPRDVLFINYLNKHISSKKRATVLSVISMVKSTVYVIIYPIGGLLMDYNPKLTLLIFGVIIILAQFVSKVEEKHLID